MLYRNLFMAAVSLLLLGSCSRNESSGPSQIPYVRSAIRDTSSLAHKALSRPADLFGTIAVIGPAEEALLVAEDFLTTDTRDNISAREVPDSLPDFSGEVIQPVLDIANQPYSDYVTLGNEAFLRELNVRNMAMAVDTAALRSPFDTTNSVRKIPAKAVVYASTYSSAFGYADADTLVKALGSDVRVFSPVHSMVSYAARRHPGRLNVAVWTTEDKMGAGVYSILGKEFPRQGINGKYSVFAPPVDSTRDFGSLQGRFLAFLDSYAASGEKEKLSAMFLDDIGVDPDELGAIIDSIKNTDEDIMLVYKNMLAPSFECIWPGRALAEECYDWMRSSNLFTHRISYPDLSAYLTAPSTHLSEEMYDPDGGLSYAFRYSRVPGSGEETYTIVELREKYINSALVDYMREHAPKFFSFYGIH